jgi:parallel beta-helix repeat protein
MQHVKKKRYVFVAIVLASLLIASFSFYRFGFEQAKAQFSGVGSAMPKYNEINFPCSVIIDTNTTHVFYGNCSTWKWQYISTNASKVSQFAIENSTNGGVIHYKLGTYSISNTIIVNQKYLVIEGEGWGTILKLQGGKNVNVFNMTGTGKWHQTIRDLQIDGNKAYQTTGGRGIYVSHTYQTTDPNVLIENVWVNNVYDDGIYVESGTGTRGTRLVNSLVSWAGDIAYRLGGTDNIVIGCVAENCGGHSFAVYGGGQYTANKAFGAGYGTPTGKFGWYLYELGGSTFVNCFADECDGAGWVLWDTQNCTFSGCEANSNNGEGFRFDASASGLTSYNFLTSCISLSQTGLAFTQTYGFRLKTNSAYNVLIGSRGIGSTAGIHDVGTSNYINLCWNVTTWVS